MTHQADFYKKLEELGYYREVLNSVTRGFLNNGINIKVDSELIGIADPKDPMVRHRRMNALSHFYDLHDGSLEDHVLTHQIGISYKGSDIISFVSEILLKADETPDQWALTVCNAITHDTSKILSSTVFFGQMAAIQEIDNNNGNKPKGFQMPIL